MKSLSYLPHLDGLRALAFVYVLLFHFQLLGATGGYLGVDIFLVLSGFLMTRILLRDIGSNTFSMARFMVRRFWRLYPALLTTVFLTQLASLVLFSPKLHSAVGASSLSALLFSSNVYFQRTTGYFDIGTELKPLLHTWSLSLEEQFYFFWPLLLYLAHHHCGPSRRRIHAALFAAMSLSFFIAVKSWRSHSFTFFLLPSRIFEFAFGGLLSLFSDDLTHLLEKGRLHEFSAFLGIFLLNYPVFRPPSSNLPGPSSVLTLLGTALLILSPSTFVGKHVLSAAPTRLLGKLSYAGYLVHWPLWVFACFTQSGAANVCRPTLLALTIALAYALHVGVENQLRRTRSRAHSVAVFLLLAAALTLAAASVGTRGLPRRAATHRYNMLARSWRYNARPCAPIPSNHVLFANMKLKKRPRACYIGPGSPKDTSKPLRIASVLVGSSFSYHLIPAFRLLSLRRKEGYLVLHHESCPLIARNSRTWPWVLRRCYGENRRRMDLLRTLPAAKVLLADYWTQRFAGGAASADLFEGHRGARQYFRSVCGAMRSLGHNLTVVGEPPVVGEVRFEGIKSCELLKDMRVRRWWSAVFGDDRQCATTFAVSAQQTSMRLGSLRLFREDKTASKCDFFDQFPGFCEVSGGLRCMVSLPDRRKMVAPSGVDPQKMTDLSLYWEGVHLNHLGSWHASVRLNELLDRERAKLRGL